MSEAPWLPATGAIIGATISNQHQSQVMEAANAMVTATIPTQPGMPAELLQGMTSDYKKDIALRELRERNGKLERELNGWQRLAQEYEKLLGHRRLADDDDGWGGRDHVTEE